MWCAANKEDRNFTVSPDTGANSKTKVCELHFALNFFGSFFVSRQKMNTKDESKVEYTFVHTL
jgi:hypothetical protein